MVSKWSGLEFSNWMSKIKILNQQNIKLEPFYCQKKPSLVLHTIRFQSLLMTTLLFSFSLNVDMTPSYYRKYLRQTVDISFQGCYLGKDNSELLKYSVTLDPGPQSYPCCYASCFYFYSFLQWLPAVPCLFGFLPALSISCGH